ncbi:hypothetical protein KY309_00560 [Candidatus Woesearchaeota archaeon]|nr:hypothetical protein [Candidatus Woesearchaeota archaeon]MBW3016085.1 hypothetical protein [Candidatus Woesearchaeota archaeon]
MKELWYVVLLGLALGVFATFASMTPTGAFSVNLPPQWDNPSSEFAVGSSFSLNLAESFFDPDGDPLSFSVSPGEGVSAGVYGDVLVVMGEGQVTVTASDGHSVVSKVLTFYEK